MASLMFSWKMASSTVPVAVGAGMAVGTAVLTVPVALWDVVDGLLELVVEDAGRSELVNVELARVAELESELERVELLSVVDELVTDVLLEPSVEVAEASDVVELMKPVMLVMGELSVAVRRLLVVVDEPPVLVDESLVVVKELLSGLLDEEEVVVEVSASEDVDSKTEVVGVSEVLVDKALVVEEVNPVVSKEVASRLEDVISELVVVEEASVVVLDVSKLVVDEVASVVDDVLDSGENELSVDTLAASVVLLDVELIVDVPSSVVSDVVARVSVCVAANPDDITTVNTDVDSPVFCDIGIEELDKSVVDVVGVVSTVVELKLSELVVDIGASPLFVLKDTEGNVEELRLVVDSVVKLVVPAVPSVVEVPSSLDTVNVGGT
jgi:hypothetical protein